MMITVGKKVTKLKVITYSEPNIFDSQIFIIGADDDAAEEDAGDEGFPAGDNKQHEKRFQDHDFEV